MGIVIRNECCDCAVPAYPCLGDSCSLRHCRVLICDSCGDEVDKLYKYDSSTDLCEDCLLKEFEVIE